MGKRNERLAAGVFMRAKDWSLPACGCAAPPWELCEHVPAALQARARELASWWLDRDDINENENRSHLEGWERG